MTPADAIAMLDRQIARHGQGIKVKRGGGALQPMRAFVRGFKPEELVGTLKQGDRNVVLSPSTLAAFGVPAALDKVVFVDGTGTVQAKPECVYLDDVLVRINMVVRGD